MPSKAPTFERYIPGQERYVRFCTHNHPDWGRSKVTIGFNIPPLVFQHPVPGSGQGMN